MENWFKKAMSQPLKPIQTRNSLFCQINYGKRTAPMTEPCGISTATICILTRHMKCYATTHAQCVIRLTFQHTIWLRINFEKLQMPFWLKVAIPFNWWEIFDALWSPYGVRYYRSYHSLIQGSGYVVFRHFWYVGR